MINLPQNGLKNRKIRDCRRGLNHTTHSLDMQCLPIRHQPPHAQHNDTIRAYKRLQNERTLSCPSTLWVRRTRDLRAASGRGPRILLGHPSLGHLGARESGKTRRQRVLKKHKPKVSTQLWGALAPFECVEPGIFEQRQVEDLGLSLVTHH